MARRVIAGVLATFLLAVLQTTLGSRLAVGGVSPDLLFVWTLCIGLLSGGKMGALVGFSCGLLEGCLEQRLIQALAISKLLSGYGAGLLATKMFKENWLVPVVAAALLTVLNEGVRLLLSPSPGWLQADRVLGTKIVYHALLSPFAYALVSRARRRLTTRRAKAA